MRGNKRSDKGEKRLRIHVTAPESSDLQIPGSSDFHAKGMDMGAFDLNVKGMSRYECEKLACKPFVSSTSGVNKSDGTELDKF